jgi:hypothetical protein
MMRARSRPTLSSRRSEGDFDRSEAASLEKQEAWSVEYIEDFLEPRTTQVVSDHLPK